MYLILVISSALCNLVSARPRLDQTMDHALTESLSDLQLLIPLMIQDALHEQPQELTNPAPLHRARESDPSQSPSYPAPLSYPSHPRHLRPPRQPKAQKVYSLDGPFSDIPSDAFELDNRKEFTFKEADEGRITKKDLSRPTHTHSPIHTHAPHAHNAASTLLQSCLDYFQGRSQPKLTTLELILDLCTELLDAEGVEDFALDDEKRQRIYDLGTDDDGRHQHVDTDASLECECCPYEHHKGRISKVVNRNLDKSEKNDGDGVVWSSSSMLEDMFRLFRPAGGRREWMVINSKNPDERLKQYIDLKK